MCAINLAHIKELRNAYLSLKLGRRQLYQAIALQSRFNDERKVNTGASQGRYGQYDRS
jgi:hypothetical protein